MHQETNPLGWYRTVGLDELNAQAALQTRVDRKYLLAAADLDRLFGGLVSTARVLEIEDRQQFGYESTYFDTPTFESYLGAARSRPHRFKVRARTYCDSDLHYLEVKTRSRSGQTTKTRCVIEPGTHGAHDGLSVSSQNFVAETLTRNLSNRSSSEHAGTVAALRPILTTHYQRATLLVEPRRNERGAVPAPSRATVDTSLAFSTPGQQYRFFPELAIVETKTAGPPSPVDKLLWRSGNRPVKVSKFGTGLAVFHPELPATKWNRLLRRHFAWAPTHAAE